MKRRRDYLAGLMTSASGLLVAHEAYRYGLGTIASMGGGFFPFSLGCALIPLGVLIAASRQSEPDDSGPALPLDLRGATGIVGSMIVFLIVVRFGGLLPAAFAVTFVAAIGDRGARPVSTLALAFVAVLIAFVLFHQVLRLPLPLFSWG